MTGILRTIFLVSIAATLLASNSAVARSRWTRDVLPPNNGGEFLGTYSSFHRPWYGKRREFESEKKVFALIGCVTLKKSIENNFIEVQWF